ncbi:flagellar motor switch protein FliM [Escherichia marmotae]|uniref:flagellar motor switch protein FliM n=1 Tax=Escherichia marmotae TaxID=1499973 RepID=UPI003CEBEDC5
MSDNILSQDEVDSLLNGDGNGASENTLSAMAPEDDIRPYDPVTQRRVVHERLSTLEFINERFARQFRVGAFNVLHRSLDVTTGNIRVQPYHEFARNLPVMTNLNLIHLSPLRGTALFVFSPNMVFMLVENLFGGGGRFKTKADGREFTPTEQRIIQRILSIALEAYDFAWSTVYSLKTEYIRSEMQVKFTNITSSPNDIVITTPFYIELGSECVQMDICIPFNVIEPIRSLLTSPPQENAWQEDQNWRNTLASQVRNTELELVVNLSDVQMRLSQIMSLKQHDILPLDKPEIAEAYVDGVRVLSGKYGSASNQYALQVEELFNTALAPFSKESSHEQE